MNSRWNELLGAVFGLVAWYLLSAVPRYRMFMPWPHEVFAFLLSPAVFVLLKPAVLTCIVVFLAMAISSVCGYIIGCWMGLSKSARVFYIPLSVFKSSPISVFIPVFMVLFGLKYFTFPMLCIPVVSMVAINISNLLKELPAHRLTQRRLLRLPLIVYLRDIVFWETLPAFLATARIAFPFCLTLQIALDYFLPTQGGLGALIRRQYDEYDYICMYAATVIVCILGYCLLAIVDRTSERLLKWKTATSS